MKESRGKITIETRPALDDPQVTLVITAPKSEWEKVRDDLGTFPSAPDRVSYEFYDTLDQIVRKL